MTTELVKPSGVRLSSPVLAKHVAQLLALGCGCGGTQARLTLRSVPKTSIWLQCQTCGGALGKDIRKEEVVGWGECPAWDDGLRPRYDERQQARTEDAPVVGRTARQQEYDQFLAESSEWDSLRARVRRRSEAICEACLGRPAVHVHHLTYAHGPLPPAWELRAVCAECHTRLHTRSDRWSMT